MTRHLQCFWHDIQCIWDLTPEWMTTQRLYLTWYQMYLCNQTHLTNDLHFVGKTSFSEQRLKLSILQVGSSVHGILQARILEWVAIPFSRGSSQPSNWTPGLLNCKQILYRKATWEAQVSISLLLKTRPTVSLQILRLRLECVLRDLAVRQRAHLRVCPGFVQLFGGGSPRVATRPGAASKRPGLQASLWPTE